MANKECRRMHLRIGRIVLVRQLIRSIGQSNVFLDIDRIQVFDDTCRIIPWTSYYSRTWWSSIGCVSVSASMDIEVHQAIASWQINREAELHYTSGNGECSRVYMCICCHLVSDYSSNFLSYVRYISNVPGGKVFSFLFFYFFFINCSRYKYNK